LGVFFGGMGLGAKNPSKKVGFVVDSAVDCCVALDLAKGLLFFAPPLLLHRCQQTLEHGCWVLDRISCGEYSDLDGNAVNFDDILNQLLQSEEEIWWVRSAAVTTMVRCLY